ncbi:platelet-activating factor acetylhydrolase isoform II [Streptomyces sp. 3211.6]|uniref:alpha/beta hydrolase family protein n=1 Tax=Streptomyces sp. 3211.6 TaxID=1938845 RepID=UPI000EB5C8F0|nr:alpha/beta hydrolase [Streptomyces sp. 3211.6]RKT03053.1 platelet-activating factor acetylhydrolase isoform II [Streptomyces sp. 3211.6]
MITRRRTAAAAALLALLLPAPLLAASAASAAPAAAVDARTAGPELPAPTGRYAVGSEDLHLVDRSRTDPWAHTGPRELMVTLRYPAQRGTGRNPAPYMSTEEARLILADKGLDTIVDPAAFAATRAHARVGARPVDGRYPLIVLSPGFTVPRATLTSLAEDLASRGYVVAAVDHAYESAATAFPGGRILTCLACDQAQGPGGREAVTGTRAKDVSFLLDRLTGRHPAWRHAGLIDRGRIAMAGHSIGGGAALAAMAADQRIRAGADMDGGLPVPYPAAGTGGRPFMLFGSAASAPSQETGGNWSGAWPHLHGWKRWITIDGTDHFGPTDYPVLRDQLGVPHPEAPLPGARTLELTRTYVAAFFDQHLKGQPRPVLDGPRADAPEVRFHNP